MCDKQADDGRIVSNLGDIARGAPQLIPTPVAKAHIDGIKTKTEELRKIVNTLPIDRATHVYESLAHIERQLVQHILSLDYAEQDAKRKGVTA